MSRNRTATAALFAAATFAVSALYAAPALAAVPPAPTRPQVDPDDLFTGPAFEPAPQGYTVVVHEVPAADPIDPADPMWTNARIGQKFRVDLPASTEPKRAAKRGVFVVAHVGQHDVRFDQVSADGTRVVKGKGFTLTPAEHWANRKQVVAA